MEGGRFPTTAMLSQPRVGSDNNLSQLHREVVSVQIEAQIYNHGCRTAAVQEILQVLFVIQYICAATDKTRQGNKHLNATDAQVRAPRA